jgi:hypothetical protein
MNKPKFACPVCGYSETPWQKEEHTIRHDFCRFRVKQDTDKELFGYFAKEHPDIKRDKSGFRNIK